MDTNDTKNVVDMQASKDVAFIIKAGNKVVPIKADYQMQSDEVVVANAGAKFVVMQNGIPTIVNESCPACIMMSVDGLKISELSDSVSFSAEGASNSSFSSNDVAAIQNAILSGDDPTETLDAAAAGNEAQGSSNSRFVVIDYDNNEMLAQAGFDTASEQQETRDEDESLAVTTAKGGDTASISLVEGDLPDLGDVDQLSTYPVETTQSVTIEAGTQPLASDSFTFDSLTLDNLLSELNSEITSGGESVEFIFDSSTNSIIGTKNGELVLIIDLDTSTNGRDVTVDITTTLHQPIDHTDGANNSGLVTNVDDQININVSIQGTDTSNNALDNPVKIDIGIADGADPSFSTDTGVIINETTQQGDVISGQIPLDVGSDEIATIVFQVDQPSLAGITSNGEATTYTVSGNTVTIVDSANNPVMTVTIATDGSYDVKVTGPIDQGNSESTNIDLNVTATDKDGDTTDGAMNITIIDGTNAKGGDQGALTLNEGDLDVDGNGVGGTDTTYPASQSGSFVIKAGEDSLVPGSVKIDPSLQSDLITELQNELTSGGETLTFAVDSNGNLVGKLPSGVVAVTVSLQGEQQGQDLKVTVTITQNVPLDHNGSDGAGYVTSANDEIHINVPVQATDTDGDDLDTPANVDITITDGANPSFGTDSGVTLNESSDKGNVISGQIPLDVGSDAIDTIVFQADQPGLTGITSNGEATTFTVSGNTITVVDSANNPVMTVTIATDGSYEVTVTGPVDQGDSESTNIDLNITATDKDGDTTDGSMDIIITDGTNAAGGDQGALTLTEGDLDTAGDGVNPGDTDTTYPASQSGSFVIKAGEDSLVPGSVKIDPALQSDLITELQNELTSGGETLTFEVDSNGNLVGKLPNGDVAVTVSLSGEQQDQDVKVTVTIEQNVPLDHNGSDAAGYVTSANDEIHINVPVQATDTDGDDLDTPANVDITITDGANPLFGTDSGVIINETSQKGDVISGQIPLDVGSDAIDTIVFQPDQPGLTRITSNGEATTFTVAGKILTVLDSAGDTVMTVTVDTDGSYEVTVTGPIDQGDSESTNIDLKVTATDKDGDTTDGAMDITITDGTNAAGGVQGAVTLNEGDLDVAGDGVTPSDTDTTYPASQSGSFVIKAGEDSLVSGSVKIDPALQSDLITELQNELTSGGEKLTFEVDSSGNLVGKLPSGVVAVTVSLQGEQQGQDVKVSVTITQNVPLDHNGSDGTGYITSAGNELHIKVPVQATDTDGDDLDTPANVDITITDGANPSFGTDSGVTIDESTQKDTVISGQIPLDMGSDAIDTIVFQADQPSLASITSNGEATTYTVSGNTITVVDSANNPVMTVTIATDGSYEVKVTGPLDQGDSESTNIDLNVTATDKDGDTTDGAMEITITDGTNAAGNDQGAVTLNEGDLDVAGDGVNPSDTDTSYPASQSGSFVIQAGEDRLDPETIVIDPALQGALITELQNELTSGGEKLTFEVDANGNLVGTLPSGDVAVTVSLSGEQQDQDVKVTVTITQNVPLDHNGSDGAGFVTSDNDDIHINVPVQATDTDGDDLDTPANVDITITDGANPSFGTDSGVTINESTDENKAIEGQIPLNVGSDEIATIEFQLSQPSLTGITSNGQATTYTVSGNTITVVDSANNPVMTVTVDTDGSYKVTVTGPIDQGDSESTNIDLNVTATDKDGDATDGAMDITITDGTNATGGDQGALTLNEGDLDVAGDGVNPSDTDSTYPALQSGSFVIKAGEDRLVPDSVAIDPALKNALITELQNELTSGGEKLTFDVDANGNLVGKLPNGDVAVTVSLQGEQQGQDVKVTVTITQNVPLDHNGSDDTGYVTSTGDDIHINVPVQATDTDGDDLDTPANVDITITDGANPSFGTDDGVTINESSQQGDVISGQIPLDVGSDAIDTIEFQSNQPSLVGITSNGQPTTYTVSGNTITVVDSANNPVMTVTIATDGSYDVKVTGPIDQSDSESTNIDLNVTATDKDGDTTDGSMDITITDGDDASGGYYGTITLTEGDLDTVGDGVSGGDTSYPATQSGNFALTAGEDRLVPDSVQVDPAHVADLMAELAAEITSGGQALIFSLNADGDIVGMLGTEVALTVKLSAVQDGQDLTVTVDIAQNVPLDHNNTGDTTSYISSENDELHINVPVQAKDTDGDDLTTPATVGIILKDGDDPTFGTDTGVTINESSQQGDVISGQIPLDVGSDDIETIVFQADQPSLTSITSNGEATTYTVSGNTVTVVDSANNPVMTVTIATDGSYEVTVTGPIDQSDSESTNIDLNVTATDKDGDTTDGAMDITITDGTNATGGVQGAVTLNEGDLDVAGDGVNPSDTDTTYPASQSGSFVIKAGEDSLVPGSVKIDPALQSNLISELQNELTSGGEKLTFEVDSSGNLVGKLPNGDVAVTVSLSGEQQGQDVKVMVTITQNVPLDHNGSDDTGYVTSTGDDIHINVPVQATDTDGDDLDTPANVDITITDGANPSFGTDSGVTIDETAQQGGVISGQIPLDVGSDAIDTIVFQADQPSLAGITSNGQATTYTVSGNTITVVDSANNPVMTVTIATDGSYEVTVTGPVDQGDSESTNIDLNVTATDKDGDTTDGAMDITITDGTNAVGGDKGEVKLTEGDLDVAGDGVNPSDTDTTYPASQSGSFVIKAGEDRLDPDTIVIDPALQGALITELQNELTSGGETLTFDVDGNGNLVGKLPNGVVAVTVSLSGEQQDQDVKVTVTITQNVPLDHNGSDGAGYVTSANDEIHINVPVQATDTDGDDLDTPANVDITITDGTNPSFGADSGVTIDETAQKGDVISGQIPLDVGSDAIDSIHFQSDQPGLAGITSNGEATTFTVIGNTLTVLDSDNNPVMTVTIATDGSYEVTVTGPIDQGDSESTNIDLNVTATDKDGDTTDGAMDITITDGTNAAGGVQGAVTLNEGDLDVAGDGVNPSDTDTTYPASQSGSFVIKAGEDSLVSGSVKIDPALQSDLITELQNELTSGGEKLTFKVDSSGNLVGKLPNGVVAVTVSLQGEQQGQDVKVTVTITQNVPLDHNGSDDTGYVTSTGDDIHINVPVQATDTDGDVLDTPANVDITITDGANPSFGADSGITIDETAQKGDVISGQIPLDVGSDAIDTIHFQSDQPGLAGITSNGEATTFTVVGNTLTVLDSAGETVMTVTIATDGSYEVIVTGPVDQGNSESTNIDLKVTATDKDGDTTDGSMDITINDGTNAAGGDQGALTLNEGDLDTVGDGVNPGDTDTTYPASQSGSFVIKAGEDRLVPDSIVIDPTLKGALITELQNELTSGGETLTFEVDNNGNLVGKLPNGDVAVTVFLSGEQQGQDVKVTVTITQNVPLDHNGSNGAGYVTSAGDDIHINVPVQATDTDGDDLDTPANVDITITDGANPSFGTDSGVTIDETTQKGDVISGQIPLDVGSDDIETIVFQADQPSLTSITSNGEATTYTVSGNTVTVVDSANNPVMTVTIATDGSYDVKVTGPIDQGNSESTNIDLKVTATDKDGDTTDGAMDITITDGTNAAGGVQGAVTLNEGDLDVAGDGVNPSDTDTTYPASQSGSFVIKAGEDRLVPDSIVIDPALQSDLITELQNELTSGGEKLTFEVDSSGNLVGKLPNGDVAVTVTLSGEQQGQDVKVTVTITQNVPLDHNGSDGAGYVTSANDEIHINVPVQATDTDGDDLDTPANVDITITDGTNPSFGADSGVTIDETAQKGDVISGQIPLDVGSDAIDTIHFQSDQPGLAGITSNGEATTFTVVGNILTVLDSAGDTVMTVTIATDGSYEVTVTGPVDQSDSESTNIDLNVTATDKDGDTTNGAMDITITDGTNAAGGVQGAVTLSEGDLDVDGNGVGGTDTTYPASQSGSFVIKAGEDSLVSGSVKIDPALQSDLITELQNELTSGGEKLTFEVDSSGNLVGKLPNGVVAVTVSLSGEQQGQDVKVTVTITQNVPLDHNGSDGAGYVTSANDDIHINVPVQATDTDGDDLDTPANVDITITDGANPSFGNDSGVTIDETSQKGDVISGQIPLDVGSDAIDTIEFQSNQPSLVGITSNGQPTTYTVSGNTITVVDSANNPVMTVTIATDGSYEVKVTGPLDQGDSESTNIDLNVTATDKDGDTTDGSMDITITDGNDASGGYYGTITLTEGDLDTVGDGVSGGDTSYPATQSGNFELTAGEDRLLPNSVEVDPTQVSALITELAAELTSGGQALTFTLNADGDIVGMLNGQVALTVELSAAQNGQDLTVTVDISQNVPLDHKNTGDTAGYITSENDEIHIKVPVQATDTDGDDLTSPANVGIIIKDGDDPSFGTDSGITVNETSNKGVAVEGQLNLDVGSDAIATLVFAETQADLKSLTSNGNPTTYDVANNTITLFDSNAQPIMVITVDTNGKYTVTVTGPIDQEASLSTDLNLGVTATDKDGDSASGSMKISIIDGANANGGETASVEITEPDLSPNGYPVSAETNITLNAGEDRLDVTTVGIDATQQAALISELEAELTSGGETLAFTLENGVLVGKLPNGAIAVSVTVTAVQVGQDVTVTVKVDQLLPLDHNASGNSTGYVSENGDSIAIDVPLQGKDTDGDSLDNPAVVTVTIKDGQLPSFGVDTGLSLNEETQEGLVISGSIAVDTGSDDIASITFDDANTQSGFNGVTSNGYPTTVEVNGNVLLLKDSGGKTVLEVSINNDGSYTAKITGELDQDVNNLLNLPIKVTVTDDDGDTASGAINIEVTDGSDATGGESHAMTAVEGDLETSTGGTTYPKTTSDSFMVTAGEDRLDPTTVNVDPVQVAALITELESELTSGGENLVFLLSADGSTLVGTTTPGGDVAVTITLSGTQVGDDINVNVEFKQHLPLDHNNPTDTDGFVKTNGDDITISVPVQAKDTDGDDLDTAAKVDITIQDGADPVFGLDGGTTITETENSQTVSGAIDLDIGSDAIDKVEFDAVQASLVGLTTNGQATTYDVNGNVITVNISGGTHNGDPVLTITMNNDGTYTVKQDEPLDQDNTQGDDIGLTLGVTATDKDGDVSNNGQVIITIKDGQDATGENVTANLTVVEGDLDNPVSGKEYPSTGSGSFTVEAVNDNLVSNTMRVEADVQTDLLAELNSLTSNGALLTFTLTVAPNGVITITGMTQTGSTEILEITLTPTQLANGDVSVAMAIEQSGPLDHTNGSGTYVNVGDDAITVDIPVQMTDSDGDDLEKPVNVNVTITDGDDPKFGADSTVNLEEGDDGVVSGTGQIDVDTGSDDVVKVYFDDMQSSLNGLTSNGEATTYTVSADGSTIIVTLVSDPDVVVMEATVDIDGNYTVDQKQPIDQVDDKAGDNENIILDVLADDKDGDTSAPGHIKVVVNDGTNAGGGQTGAITITEGDLTPEGTESPYPVTGSTTINIPAGVDRLDPDSAEIDSDTLNALITELQNELTAGGQSVTFTYNANTGTLTGIAAGVVVMTVVVDAVQAANGHDVDITITITQNQPLDHQGGNANGMVSTDGDKITIDVPVQVADTDGDKLEAGISVDVTINDGTDPVITGFEAISVDESALNGNNKNHQGSDPSSKGEKAKGQITVDSGSDDVIDYIIDVATFNQQNAGVLMSDGQQITLSYNSNNGKYFGKAGNTTIFVIKLSDSGKYEFILKGNVDHEEGGATDEQLTITLPVQAVDQDGDKSNTVNIPVTIKDDEPTASDVTLNTVEGRTSTLEDVLSIVGEGADDATVTALIVDGVRIPLDTLPKSGEYYQYEVKDGVTVLGILLITAEGETYFSANDDLDHAIEDITKLIDVEITDGDGDTDTSTITLEISDQDATLTTHNSTGQEDSGSASDSIASNYHGIAINMDINVGDLDRGEAVGNVTITAPTPAHGVFIYDDGNGTIITLAYTDGKVTIPAAAFELQADGVTYTLGGVTFLPDSDFSTIGSDFTIDGGKLTFDVSAEIVNSDGSTHPNMDGKFTISVDGVADIPTWDNSNTTYHYEVTEDTDNVDLNLTAVLQDDDGANTSSEELYYFITIKEGQGTLVGTGLVETSPNSGIYKVAAADIGSVQVDPANNFSGDIKLDVWAQSQEKDNGNTADSEVKEIIINVNPDADNATMKVKRIESDEDELISLKDHIFLTPQDDNADGSEKLFVRISGLPTGAILFLDGQALVPDADGKYEVAYDEIDKLQLQPTPESNVDFTIKVEGVIKDTATVTKPDGTTTTDVVNEFVTGEQTIEVDLTGVADAPDFDFNNSSWKELTDGRTGLETTIKEDGSAVFDFSVISGEHALAPTDNSETLSLVISNIPEGVKIFDANGNEQALVYVGTDEHDNPKYEVNLSTLHGITITPPLNSTTDIDLDVRLVVTENDGDSKAFDGNLVIHVEPVVDATDYSKNSNGQEDSYVNLNWQPDLTDSKEVITGLVIKDLPADYDLYIGSTLIASGGGDITLTPAQVVQITSGGQSLRVKGPEDSDVDLTLKMEVTVTEVDVDSAATDVKTIEGILNVNINAVVEDDGKLAIVDNSGDVTNKITSDANGVIDININTTGDQTFTNGLSFLEDDLSSTEVIEKVIITLVDADGNTITDQSILDQFLVMGGINNGDGSWTVPQSELGNLQVIATVDQTSTVYVHISAEIRDLGDNSEGDSSSAVTKEIGTVIELDFQGSSGGSQLAGNIDVDNDVIIIGTEDNHLNFGNQLDAFISVSIAGSHHENDEFTLVIDASTLPDGVSITGAEYNYETGEYVLKVPVDSEGHVNLSAVGIKLPEDFAGDFELGVKYVTTDTVSGDVKEVSDTIPVQVNPVVDIPGNSQTGDHTPEVEISVVKTNGLDGSKQPISDGSADHDYVGVAYEDGDITLDLSVVLADSSTSLTEGLETVTSVTLTVDPAKGFFVAADGSLVSEITLPASELSNIQFRPVEDFSGSVSVGVKVDITDTANFDQTGGSATDTGSYNTNVNFEVVAVNDAVNWTGTDKVVVGQEDAGGVSLAGIGGTIVDVDGSEQILSIKLTGVPEGFIIEGAVNNSNGEWSISLPSGQTAFNLNNIKVIPPEDFSGEVELNVVVYSKEDSLTEVAENSTSITIDVQPVADRVDTDVETEASGTENDTAGIDLILNVEAFDDKNSYDGSASNVTEKGPEGLQITLTNVPESSSIALPDGVAGTATNMGGGVWVVTVESSDLDKLIFHPGDANSANSVNWDGNINVDIRAVDNGVVAIDSIAVDEIIHVDVEAENDAPVNVLPSNLTADEDVPLLINSLKVVDVDANETANGEMTVTLNVGDGTLNIPDSFDWAALGLQVTGEESDTLIISGSLDDINALLASGVEYTGDTNFNGDDTLTMTTNDQANSGTGPAEGLTDTDSITITVNPVNDAPVNTVPNAVTAEEDGSTVITGIQISDVDFAEAGTTGSMSVTLNVAHGILSVDTPVGSSVVVIGQGTDTVMITGSMDDINALLNNGVTYEGDDNYSGADELTMTTHDGGNVGSGTNDTAISKVPVTVTPKADAPTLSLDNSFIQTAAIRGSLGTMIPLLGLIAVLTDTDGSETLSIMVKNLAGADLVNSNGDVIAGNQGNGTWVITKENLADLNVIGLPEGENNLEVVAVSEETDGSKAESAPVDINVVVENLANTGNQIGGSSSSDAANLVIDSSAEAILLGGDGNDILIGGAASDILVGGAGDDIMWGGEQGGTGDGVEDIFKWQAGDFGTAANIATDTIMDFEVGIDKIDLTDAFSAYDSMSLTDLSSLIKLTGNGTDSTLEIYDDQGSLIQNIVLNGVAESVLLGSDPASMSDEDKISALLNSGQLDVANNFGDAGENTLVADNSGENLYGFDGNDILTGGAGDDFLTGGNGNNLFTWDAALSNEDVITDFKLDQDQLDLSQILSDDGDDKFDMNDLLGHVTSGDLTASFDNDGKVNLSVTNSDSGDTQSIVLENIDSASLGDVSQADILNQLFSHDAFKVDSNL